MALASQSTRSERTAGTSRSRGGATFIVVTAAAFAAAAGAYILFTGEFGAGGAPRAASAASGMLAEVTLSDSLVSSRRDALDSAAAGATEETTAPAASPSVPADSAPVGSIPSQTPATLLSENPSTESDNSARTESSADPTDTLDPTPSAPQSPPVPPADQPSDKPADKPADKPGDPTTTPAFGNGLDNSAPQAPAAQPPATPAEAKLRDGLALAATEPVKARLLLSQAVLSNTLAEPEARQAADALSRLSAQLFLTPVFNANDPICTQYTIQPNDSLEKIVRKQKLGCDWRLVARINRIKNPAAIQVGKRLKLPVGPFSAVVSKRDYRIYLCTGTGDDRVVVAALAVGLGEANGTPTGRFKVRANSKLINPEWTHPVTGQRYEADDPANPIGEYWLGIEGVEDSNSALLGYGIHGTIDNDSIGHDRSLGCVRLLADDVALVWETLAEGSAVEIWRGAGS